MARSVFPQPALPQTSGGLSLGRPPFVTSSGPSIPVRDFGVAQYRTGLLLDARHAICALPTNSGQPAWLTRSDIRGADAGLLASVGLGTLFAFATSGLVA